MPSGERALPAYHGLDLPPPKKIEVGLGLWMTPPPHTPSGILTQGSEPFTCPPASKSPPLLAFPIPSSADKCIVLCKTNIVPAMFWEMLCTHTDIHRHTHTHTQSGHLLKVFWKGFQHPK